MDFARPFKRSVLQGAALGDITASLLVLSPAWPQSRNRRQSARKPVDKLPSAAKRWALVVSMNDYNDPSINRLNGAINDARSIAEALVFAHLSVAVSEIGKLTLKFLRGQAN